MRVRWFGQSAFALEGRPGAPEFDTAELPDAAPLVVAPAAP